jgi:membrane-associated phospholipid phosphatase
MKKFVYISLAILAVLLIILAIGDLDYTVSLALINESSIFGEFFNLFGEFPAYIAMVIGSAMLFATRRRDIKWRNILGAVLGVLFNGLFSFLVIFAPVNYRYEHTESGMPATAFPFIIIGAVVLAVVSLWIAVKHREKLVGFRRHAWILVLLPVFSTLFVNLLKPIWGRPRMRSIDDISEFKHWYEINGWSNDNELKSFPSGHTALGFVAIAYSMFIPYIKSIKPRVYMAFALTWGVLVGLSRVVIGAHFLSDVLVAGYITIYAYLIMHKLILKKTPLL